MDRPHWYPRGSLPAPYLPVEIDDATEAFPAGIARLLPPAEAIPEQFGRHLGTKWNRFVGEQFFAGVKDIKATPREGIDPAKAWRHYSAIVGSWEPKHEYKEAAAAYLLSVWFEDIDWKKANAA
jgi:hypothetical protein